jgi:hypothetical protein
VGQGYVRLNLCQAKLRQLESTIAAISNIWDVQFG